MLPNLINLEPQRLFPALETDDLDDDLETTEDLRSDGVILTDEKDQKKATLSPIMISKLLTSDEDGLALDEKMLRQYVHDELSAYYFKAPVHTRKTGKLVTTKGQNGSSLDVDSAIKLLTEQIATGAKIITLPSSVMNPAVIQDGVYPKTNAGLHALISDFDAEKFGDYQIIVHSLRDGGLHATHQALKSTLPASTYKAFIAYAVMHDMELGKYTFNSLTTSGSVRDCMYEMIHVSTDHCAWAIQDLMGWQHVDDLIHQAGMEDTFINNEDFLSDKYTTAMDEFKLMRGFYDKTLLNNQHTKHIIDLFKGQLWRNGIPAGSAPSIVANKVGFFVAHENDIGIVYAPKGDYIIVALSDGGSFWEISDLSRRVYNFFGN